MQTSEFSAKLVDRFLRYVAVDTQAVEDTDQYPSSEGQFTLGRHLVEELKKIGLADVSQNEHGYVIATIPATPGYEDVPVIALFAHLDTSPEKSGANVKAVVHRKYQGKDILLPGDENQVIKVSENPNLKDKIGEDIITSDGKTLLGADDKSGIAEIVTAADILIHNDELEHGTIRVVFTCDEEVGRGVDYLKLSDVKAHVGYTMDGGELGEVEGETFSADLAVVHCRGFNTHPGLAKNKLVNGIKAAAAFIEGLPKDGLSPELTEDKEGFVHPYVIEGGVDETIIKIIVRDFETPKLAEYENLLKDIGKQVEKDIAGSSVEVEIKEQYRNMREGLEKEPRAMSIAIEAMKKTGIEPKSKSIRGGTDGSRLTAMGLPTPNLFAGGHNFHSTQEWVSIQDMEKAVLAICNLVNLWSRES